MNATKKEPNLWPIFGWVALCAVIWLLKEFDLLGLKAIHVWTEADVVFVFLAFLFLYNKLEQILDKLKEPKP